MFKRLANFAALCIFFNTLGAQTCDVDLIGFDPETNQISVAILNSENCGCNEYTQQDGNTCDESASSVVDNNESITHFVFGLHIYEDYTAGPCSQANFHPGWTFAYPPGQTMLPFTGGHVTGDTVNIQLTTFNDWDCLLNADLEEGQCWQLVVWQINLSQSADPDDFPTEFWTDTCGTCANQTQMYPDVDLSNNSIVWCPDELPPPPLYPGCTDPTADNFDPDATWDDGSCTYTILGCTDPTACNYDQTANENDGSCITCENTYEEGVAGCGQSTWEWYINLFDCNPEVDMLVDNGVIVEVDCDIFNTGTFCQPGIWFTFDFTNVSDEDINTWYFEYSGPNGYMLTSSVYGVTQDPPYDNPLTPGENRTVNVLTQDVIWQAGDTLTITAIIDGQEDSNLENNILHIILPEYPTCEEGCEDPTATNYNPNVTCPVEELCIYPPVDIAIDSLYFPSAADCQLGGPDSCTPTIRWNTIYSNIGEVPINSWYFETTGPNGYFTTSPEYGVNYNGGDNPYANPIMPGDTAPIINTLSFSLVWEPGDEICITVFVIDQDEVVTENNTYCITIPFEYPDCQWGCTDPAATNYNPNATCDNGNCQYPVVDAAVDSLTFVEGCLEGEPFWQPTLHISNPGGIDVTEFCIKFQVLGQVNDTLCFDTLIPAGESIELEWPNQIFDYGAVSIHMLDVNGESEQEWNNFGDDTNISNNMVTFVVGGPTVECDFTELTYVSAECSVDCGQDGPFWYVITTWTNTGTTEITDFCAEWDVLGGEGDDQECWEGSLMPGETTQLQFGPYTENGSPVAWAYLQVVNGEQIIPQIENYETLYCYEEAEALCVYGCTDPEANNYDPNADLDDGSCTYDILGCTDPEANNFDPTANVDDGSCTYDIYGCTDPMANNYDPLATIDNGMCTYDVLGCTDPNALNYDPLANVDDGSCQYDVLGCTDPTAANYNPLATVDDGSCYFVGPDCTGEDGLIFAPNTFTPNNDGVNDGWRVEVANPDCWRSWYVAIFNRWGGLIWESYTPGETWPGSVFDGNHYVADGVYVYLVQGEGWDPAITFKKTGHITIFR